MTTVRQWLITACSIALLGSASYAVADELEKDKKKKPYYMCFAVDDYGTQFANISHYDNYAAKGKHKKKRKYRRYGFPSRRPATGNTVFIFSPRMKMWAAYSPSGRLIRTGRASGGKGYCPDVRRACRTPRGIFRVYSKGSPRCRSSKYPVGRGGAPMPYCMFFYRGYAIHGSPNVPNYNASHGCIRVRPSAAAWLSRQFMRIGTTVIVWPY